MSLRANDPVQLLQGLEIEWDVFQHATSNHDIEGLVFVGESIRMSQLGIFQATEAIEGAILKRFHVAPVDFHVGSQEHTNHTCIGPLATAPIKHPVRPFEEMLAALKNADLAADNSSISRVRMKVTIVANFSLQAIESGKFGHVVGHIHLDQ